MIPKAKIIHTPKDFRDHNQIMRLKLKEAYGRCPFCGESKLARTLGDHGVYHQLHYERYGKPKPLWRNLFANKTQWYFYAFKCNSCGAEWETEEFPEIKIKGVKSLPMELWENGE